MNPEQKIVPINIEDEMKSAYIDYSMSVIVSRALPDVRDGLKPVHRRVLYSMSELGVTYNKAHKKSARIVGECFVAGTLVNTPKGLIPIEVLNIGDSVFTQKGTHQITHLYEMPEQPLLEIRTKNSAKTIATKGQQYKVVTPDFQFVWKKAEELQAGDFLVSRSVWHTNENYVQMGTTTLDEDTAYLLGFFLADGWVDRDQERGYHRLSWASESMEILQKIQHIIQQKWNVHCEITTKSNNFYQLRINNTELNRQLISDFALANKYAHNIQVPNEIFQSKSSVFYAFLAGVVDGDGSVHNTRNQLNISSISESFIEQLQTALFALGIYAKVYKTEAQTKQWNHKTIEGNYDCFALEIGSHSLQKLAAQLSLQHPTKQAHLQRIAQATVLQEQARKIPFLGKQIFTEFSEKHLGGGWYQDADGNKFRSGIKYQDGTKIRYSKDLADSIDIYFESLHELGILSKLQQLDSVHAQTLLDLEANGIVFTEVVSIAEAPAQKTFDIQVETAHEFIANGVVVHNCLGKFHPHGDSSVYDTMVRMAQDWSLRYPLVDGQGNFGSVDGDSPAAMRYTEARLARISNEILADLEKDTVNWQPNFDDSLQEPTVLPTKMPNLLMNGATGIAVGMATNMMPHNLSELVDGIVAYLHLDKTELSEGQIIDKLMEHIKAPDFPTGGTIYGTNGVREAFHTGRGRVVVRGKAEIENIGNREQIIVTEIPYQVNKANLIMKIAEMVNDKKIEGISDIRDESDRNGMRIVFELKRDANSHVVLSNLYKYSALQSSFGVNNICLVGGRPFCLNLHQLISEFIKFRLEVILRRTKFDLKKALDRAHIIQGLLAALDRLDDVISLIRKSKTVDDAKFGLMEMDFAPNSNAVQAFLKEFPLDNHRLSEEQAKAILEMRLQRLTGLERDKLEGEYRDLLTQIADFNDIIEREARRYEIIEQELLEIKERFGDVRRTSITPAEGEISLEDMIADETEVVTISHLGYIKRTPVTEYRTQSRGGRGAKAAETREEDFIENILIANTHDYLLVFTQKGRCYWIRVYELPKGNKTSKGRAVQNLLQMSEDDKIKACIVLENQKLKDQEFLNSHFIIFATKQAVVKKTTLEAFSRPRTNGINAINIRENDELLDVKLTNGKQHIILASSAGKAIRFDEDDVRDMGRGATGVRGMSIDDEDEPDNAVIGMVCVNSEDATITILTVSENGVGKRTDLDEYRVQTRGGKGSKTINITEKTGKLISIKAITENDDLMIINKSGLTIRLNAKDLPTTGRATQGVRLISVRANDAIADVTLISEAQIGASAEDILEDENAPENPETTTTETTETTEE